MGRSIPSEPKAVGVSGKPSVVGATQYKKAPGQGPGPSLEGGSADIRSAVPGRILESRMIRRASSQSSGTLAPGKLVNHARNFGAK